MLTRDLASGHCDTYENLVCSIVGPKIYVDILLLFSFQLKFYIDDQYVTQITAQSDVEFVAPGQVYLGGTPKVAADTRNLITSNIDGAITNVSNSVF